jgi:hypothetical protein
MVVPLAGGSTGATAGLLRFGRPRILPYQLVRSRGRKEGNEKTHSRFANSESLAIGNPVEISCGHYYVVEAYYWATNSR